MHFLLSNLELISLSDTPPLVTWALSNDLVFTISKIVFVPSSKDPYEQLDMLQIIKNCLIDSTKNDNEKLTELKKLIYLKNYLNALLLLGLNVNESYENIIKY